ncbi:unnamed protein product [Oikopleura dioica]|uniref:Uncharacterized protein n=1 Tax=Oikopleura dioica TaxID=34765 RepID=E4XRB2_OIKDI|nr:unnamed protein product [Oikopleura dioica]
MAERSQAKSVDYASFHKTFEVNCPVKSGKQTHNEELERQKKYVVNLQSFRKRRQDLMQ